MIKMVAIVAIKILFSGYVLLVFLKMGILLALLNNLNTELLGVY